MDKKLMKKYKHYIVSIILFLSVLFTILQTASAEQNDVTLEFFYRNGCPLCNDTKPIINAIEEKYVDRITVKRYLVTLTSENYTLFNQTYGFYLLPAVVLSNQTDIIKFNATQISDSVDVRKDIENAIGSFLPPIVEPPIIEVEYFYGETCGTCKEETTPIIDQIEVEYAGRITVKRYPVESYPENYNKMKSYGLSYPAVVVLNTSNGKNNYLSHIDLNFTLENLESLIDYHLIGDYSENPEIKKNANVCFFNIICIDPDDYSLPVLTVVLGLLDSLNPCSFFIFLVLLSILIHMQSRKRMFLVAGIFIFVSGAFYFLLMVAFLNVYTILEFSLIIAVIGGVVAIVFGSLNIKDFFLFKQGPSLSISEEKKSKLYSQIRKVAKISSLTGLIAYAIILAISVNTVELICSLIVPLTYTNILTSYNLPPAQNYFYILIYNILYVLPLIILAIIFGIIKKQWKMSEWQGRLLKLYSGVLIVSLGLILIINRHLLKKVEIAVGVIIIDILVAFIISFIWKKRMQKQEIQRNYPSE